MILISVFTFAIASLSHQGCAVAATPAPVASTTVSRPSADTKQVIIYKMQKIFAMNSLAKICAVISFALPIVVITAYLYKKTTGVSMTSAMFKTYSILQDTPGADACGEDSFAAGLVANLTHVLGIFTYALVLGVVVDDVGNTVTAMTAGNTKLYESGHTVILNNNRHTRPLLKQWATAQKEMGHTKGTIVVLADMPKSELDEIVDEMRGETGMEILGREGRAYDISDLEMVSTATASTVILMDPFQGQELEGKMVPAHTATLVSLAAIGAGPAHGQTLVMQMPDTNVAADMLTAASNLHKTDKSRVVAVRGLKSLAELQAQCAVQPGLAAFYNQTFTQSDSSPELYVHSFDSLEGRPYREVRRLFKSATVVGYTNDSGVYLNPSDDYVIQKGDGIVGLTGNVSAFEPKMSLVKQFADKIMDQGSETAAAWTGPHASDSIVNKDIMVLCFDQPSPETVKGLEDFLPRKARVTFVSAEDVELPRGKFRARHFRGSPASTQSLLDAGLARTDSVIITGVSGWEPMDADIQVLSSITQLSDACLSLDRSTPLHIVAQARGGAIQEFTDALAAGGFNCYSGVSTDILYSDDIVAGILAQTAIEPRVAPVLQDMLDADGTRAYLRGPQRFADPGETLTMADVEERARLQSETVVGYNSRSGNVVTGLSKGTSIKADDVKTWIVIG